MKKGQFSNITKLILALGTLLLLSIFFSGIKALFVNESTDLTCKASVLQIESTGVGELQCPVQKIEVKQSQVDNKVARAVIADRMANCWDTFGKGELKPFDKDWLGNGEIICKICDQIKFEDGIKASELNNFRDFLKTTKAVRYGDIYSKFLYDNFDEELDYFVPDTIDTSKTYYTVYQTFQPDRIEPGDVNLGFLSLFTRVDSSLWLVESGNLGILRCEHEYD